MAKKKSASSKSVSRASKARNGGMLFVAAMFVGMGVGALMDQMVFGLFVGMGVGFGLKYYVER
jgi:F0F1-type ATP synthase assembly protein I